MFHWSTVSRRAAQHKAVRVMLIFISGRDSSTQLQSWHSSVLGVFGVAVFLPPQYKHTGLYWDPPGAWDHLHPHMAPTCNLHPRLNVS